MLLTPCTLCLQEGFQRAKTSVMTQPDPADPLRDCYGDAPLVQSRAPSGLQRTRIQDISTALDGQLVRLRSSTASVHSALQPPGSWSPCGRACQSAHICFMRSHVELVVLSHTRHAPRPCATL